jgi:hypothetical protein
VSNLYLFFTRKTMSNSNSSAQRQSDGTAEVDAENKTEHNGGCHAQLVVPSSDFIAEAPTPDNPSGLNYWRDREISPSTVCLWTFPSLSELLLGVQCLSVGGIWDRNSRYGQLLRDVSNLWTTLDRPSISWPEYAQEKVILPVSVVMGYLQTWMDGVNSAQRPSALTGDSPLSDAPCCASSDFIPPLESGSARHNDKSLIARFAAHPNAAKIMDEALVNLDVLVDLGKNTRVCPDHLVVWIRRWQEFGRPNPARWYRAFCSGEVSRIRKAGLPLTLGQENQQEGLVQDSSLAQRPSALTGGSPLSDAACCVSSEVLKLREARAKFDEQTAASSTGRPSKANMGEYLLVISQVLLSVHQDLQRLSTSDACQNPEDHQDQLQPCTDG